MHFFKLEAAGNDYILFDCLDKAPELNAAAIRCLCDRHMGVGADGVIVLSQSVGCDARMEIYNSDGSRGAMCGNGLRCAAKYLCDAGIVGGAYAAIESDSGARLVRAEREHGVAVSFAASLGSASFLGELHLFDYTAHLVNVGNSHAVVFCRDVSSVPLERLWLAASHALTKLTDGVNLEVCSVAGGSLTARVHERGAGETLSCGTGAAAAAAVAMRLGLVCGNSVNVKMPGGELCVSLSGDSLILSGSARMVFCGETPFSLI